MIFLIVPVVSVILPFILGQATDDLPSATLYENEDKSGKSVNFFDYSSRFRDVQQLIDNKNLKGAALLCAKGVFVLYNDENFATESEEDVRILAGADEPTCLPPGQMKSLQFIQSYGKVSSNSLVTFSDEQFSSNAHIFTGMSMPEYEEVKSLVYIGTGGWTVQTVSSAFCLQPENPSEFSICPVSKASRVLDRDSRSWLMVSNGCAMDIPVKTLKYCFARGTGKLEAVHSDDEEVAGTTDATGTMMTTPETKTEVTGTGGTEPPTDADSSECMYNSEFTTLLRLRLTHDFDSVYQIQFPLNKIHAWRTEILDNTMEIVAAATLGDLINVNLLRYLREMYIYLAEQHVWEKGTGWPPKPKERVILVGQETQRCLYKMETGSWAGVTRQIGQKVLSSIKSGILSDEDVSSDFKSVKGYDIAMEFVWLSVNFVGAACHAALEFQTDFWLDYMSVAFDMLLRPMAEYWAKPGNVLKYYPILLGGYDIKTQYRALAATTSLLYKASGLDKLPRPNELMSMK